MNAAWPISQTVSAWMLSVFTVTGVMVQVMMKRKGHKKHEPQNLKRFRASVEKFTQDQSTTGTKANDSDDEGLHNSGSLGRQKSRKLRRKEERKLKKMRKDAFQRHVTLPTAESLQKEKDERMKANQKRRKMKEKRRERRERKQERKRSEVEEKEKEEKAQLDAVKEDDHMIKQMEKNLKLNKRKSKNLPQSFVNDGLDYILDAVDGRLLEEDADLDTSMEYLPGPGYSDGDESEDADASGSDESDSESDNILSAHEEALPTPPLPDAGDVTGILKGKPSEKAKKQKNVCFVETGNATSQHIIKSPKKISIVENDIEALNSDEETLHSEEENETEAGKVVQSKSFKYTEDIYGRLRDSRGNVLSSSDTLGAGKSYVPPALRTQLTSGQDEKKKLELERMKKQLKGLINRLSESNLQPISSQIEALFRSYSRAELSETLTQIIFDACVSWSHIPERLITEHVLLVAILHRNVGSEVGAVFLQMWAQRFHGLYDSCDNSGGKELDNLLVLLAQLCNFKVVHSLLVFDVIDHLVERFAEKDIELLLVILKNVGFTLRKDDAAALKAAILKLQTKAAAVDTTQYENRSRLTFMLDILMAIRNNNMRKIPNYDPSHVDHLRKIMHNCQRGSSSVEDALRISLDDLLHCEEKGRWWLVGSAWSGRDTDAPGSELQLTASVVDDAGMEILDLARKQRMNTDVRKTIFCVLMTSEDYVDAFEKLLRLSLTHQQEREILHVTMDVCLQETPYNPYYALIAQKFSECHRRHQMTIQFNLWDKFKEVSQLPEQKANNLADFLTHLLVTQALSLSVFKTIQFAELDKNKVRFMKRVLWRLLVEQPENIVRATFERISPLVKLRTLREGLRLFMQHFLLRRPPRVPGGSTGGSDSLAERIKMAEVALASADTKMSM